jgi:hypothetical protein
VAQLNAIKNKPVPLIIKYSTFKKFTLFTEPRQTGAEEEAKNNNHSKAFMLLHKKEYHLMSET